MRTLSAALSFSIVGFAVVLFVLLLYDATEVARALGLEPTGTEGVVAVAGLVLAAAALIVGARALLRPSPGSSG